jgi:hypothetical protein
MPTDKTHHPSLHWLAALAALGTLPAQAQERGLSSPGGWPNSPALEVSQTRAGWDPSFKLGPVRLMPSLQAAPGGFWSGALSVNTGGKQSISLQLVRDRRASSLGLAVSYDWPRYFVRVGLDQRSSLMPQETLRFSAGMRF